MEEKGTIHIHLLTELTGNLYSEESEWEEDWSESDEYGMPLDGTELADYEEVIREELKRYGEDDLMQYFDGSESIQGKIQSAVVTIENKDGILYGCTKLELNELLSRKNYRNSLNTLQDSTVTVGVKDLSRGISRWMEER